MKNILILIAIMFVLVPVSSMASRGGGGSGGFGFEDGKFWGADLDRNERLDKDEAKSVYNLAEAEIFARYDEDGNGTINRVEFMEFIQQSPWTDAFVHPKDK